MNEARAPTDGRVREQVLREYKSGVGPTALAEKTGISINTIKSWIKRDKAKESKGVSLEEKGAPQKKPGAPQKKKPGAPTGNKNAVGHGAPKCNTNALKHGGYSSIYWDMLDEDEQAMLEEAQRDEEEMLLQQILLFDIRERRLMKAINQYKTMKGGVYVYGVIRQETKRSFKDEKEAEEYAARIQEKVEAKERLPGEAYTLQTTTSSTVDLVARLERELTSVQSKKTKAIDSLAKLRLEKQKLEGESKGNELVHGWVKNVIKKRSERRNE